MPLGILVSGTLTGTGTQTHEATGDVVLAVPTMSGVGAFAISGTGAVSLPATEIAGTGAVVPVLTATGEVVLGGVSIAGVGDNGDYVPPIPPVGRRRRAQEPLPEPEPIRLVATGAISLPAIGVRGAGDLMDDDLWLYLEPAVYLAGAVNRWKPD